MFCSAAEDIKKIITKDVEDTAIENKKMIEEVKASHEHYKKRQKQLFTGIGAMLSHKITTNRSNQCK